MPNRMHLLDEFVVLPVTNTRLATSIYGSFSQIAVMGGYVLQMFGNRFFS